MRLQQHIFREALVKLAARCNLNCTYCYWFRDASVYDKPAVLTPEAERAFLFGLETHIRTYHLHSFSIILHGGEPLLFEKSRFVGFMDELDAIQERTHCTLRRALTTNGVLIDEEWARLFRLFNVNVTVSIDGPASIHDKARRDFKGQGSYLQVERGVKWLRDQGLEPGVLAVCDPTRDPVVTARHFVEVLGFTHFDILVPDATHEDAPVSIAPYYKTLFDLWYDDYRRRGITVRYLQTLVMGLLESVTSSGDMGYNPVETLTVLTDGSLEPVDVLRIAGNGSTRTNLSVLTHTFQDLIDDPCWREACQASHHLPAVCQACVYVRACGGGYLPHRWSQEKRYDNPSVYCADLKEIFSHIWEHIAPDLHLVTEEGRVRLLDLLNKETS